MTAADSSYAYNQAFALNNIGVTMMMQGRFDQAASTLKDSLTLVRMALGRSFGNQAKIEVINSFATEKLRFASSRLSQMTAATFCSSSCENNVNIAAVESNDFQSLQVASSRRSILSSSIYALIIREPCQAQQEQIPESDLELESGIILYNYGLACYLMANGVHQNNDPKNLRRDTYYSMARRSLLMSHATFSRRLFACEDRDGMSDLETSFFVMLSLSCTSKVLKSCNESTKAQEAEEAVEQLWISMEEENLWSLLGCDCVLAAPAA
eukprot:CAMPEP_0172457026 /NCGR_PEP_ID=MMETSP1065-20121228/19412_1 /TAXON_ID=265537 /ORGANISM="Amphiprora paludosa, Strain CCMP125" /LENGTH=267 /DNA_ID=CAMNT_0013210461 /DNA_START=219 /DNA_END=1022 /DNA_ORIENTATION=-